MSRHTVANLVLACLLLMSLLAAGCKRIRLYEPAGGVYLELNLDLEFDELLPCDANMNDPVFMNMAYGSVPTSVEVLVYDAGTHELVHEDFLPVEGGFIDLDTGTYDIIVYGRGAEITRLSSTANRGLGRVYTENENDAAGSIVRTVIRQPDQFYVGRAAGVEVPVRPKTKEFFRIHVDLTPLVETYSFVAYDITGLERVSSVKCYITGQAPDRYLWDGHFTVQPVSVSFDAEKNPRTYSVRSVFNTFGKIPEYTSYAIMHVQVQSASGRYFQWQYDVTDQFNNPDNTCHKIIVTDPVVIPDDEDMRDTGFGIEVEPWDKKVTDIDVH
jgi:hypothetical protein